MAQGTSKQTRLDATNGLDADLWGKVQELFQQAIALGEKEQAEFLKNCRDTDPRAREMLVRLLEQDRKLSKGWESGLASAVKQSSALGSISLPAEDIGPYRFIRPLGQGGMGTVYQARHRETGQIVAIKVLRSGELSGASRERFSTEQRALAKLNHRSIARLYATESFRDGTPCFVMEYVEGEPLMTWCRRVGVSVRDRVLLFREVCEAVQHAHEYAIIHRDLKPSNILVKLDSTVRLLDFGIAKQLDAEELTRDQPAPMTLAYAAPEQITGGTAGTHTDVYALGLVLHEMLTLRPALDLTALTPGGVEEAIRFRNPEPPSKLTKEPGNGLDARDLDLICEKAAHKDPERRYRVVQALIRDLDHWLAFEPIEARRDSVTYRVRKFARRNARTLSIGAAVAFSIALGTTWFVINLAAARNVAIHEQVRTKRLENFTLSLFDDGDPEAGPSKSATALTMLDRGRKVADALRGEPELQTDLYEVLGNLYDKVGRFKDSGELLDLVVRRRGNDLAVTTKDRAASIFALATLRAHQSRFLESGQLARTGFDLVRNDRKSTAEDLAGAQTALGTVLMNSRNFKEAIPLLQDSIRILDGLAGDEGDQISKTLVALAGAQQEAGNFVEAENLMRRGLAVDLRVYGAPRPQVADDRKQLGHIYLESRRCSDALPEYRQALDIYINWYGKEHPATVETLVTMGEALLCLKQYQAARDALAEGVAFGDKVFEPANEVMVLAVETRGTLEQQTGNVHKAIAYFEQASRRARAMSGDHGSVTAVCLSNLALAHFEAGEYSQAELPLREALNDMVQDLPPGHQNIASAKLNLGKTLLKEGKFADAKANLQEALISLNRLPTPRPDLVEKANAALAELKASRP